MSLAVLLWAPVALAQATPAPDRPSEDAMFGGPAPAPASAAPAASVPAAAPPTTDRPSEDAMFGGPPPTPASAESTPTAPPPPTPSSATAAGSDRDRDALSGAPLLREDAQADATEDKLQIGGDLLLRLQSTFATDTDAADQALSAPGLLDVYLDARPSDRVRIYVEGRLTYDPTLENGRAAIPDFCTPRDSQGNLVTEGLSEQEQKTLDDCMALRDGIAQAFATPAETSGINQLWMKFDAAQSVFFTVGRQPVKWGAAHLWNPTDFINRQIRDPLQQVDLRPGVSLIKVHVPWESQTANFYALALLDESRRVGDVGGAARVEWAFESAEISVSAAGRRDAPLLLGADFSLGVWQLDLYGEGAVAHGHHAPLPGERDRSDDWIPHVSGGFSWDVDYGDEDVLTWGLEYAFNDDGVDDKALYGAAVAAGRSVFTLPRQAAGAYVVLLAPGRLDDSSIFATCLMNLDDRSGTARLQWSERVLTWLSVQPYVGAYFGDEGDLYRFNLNAADPSAAPAYLTADAGVWLSARM